MKHSSYANIAVGTNPEATRPWEDGVWTTGPVPYDCYLCTWIGETDGKTPIRRLKFKSRLCFSKHDVVH